MDFFERAEKYANECVSLYNDEGGLKGFKALSQLHREMIYNKEAFQKSLESNKKILLDKILINFTEALVSINNESFESNHSYVLKHSSLEHLKTLIDKYFQDGNIREYEREKILTQIFDEIENQSERLGLNNYRIDLYPTHRLGFSFLSAEKARHRALKLNSYLFASNFVLDKIIDLDFKPVLKSEELEREFKESIKKAKIHKDTVNEIYGELKREKSVDDAFYSLIDTLEEKGLQSQDYFTTDTPQNFDRAYREWLKKERKRKQSS